MPLVETIMRNIYDINLYNSELNKILYFTFYILNFKFYFGYETFQMKFLQD